MIDGRVTVFMGTRPEAIKLLPVVQALRDQQGLTIEVVMTGQHREMVDQIMGPSGIEIVERLDVMRPDQTLAGLSARLLEGIDRVLAERPSRYAVVQGDTTTALCAGLAAFYRGVRVGHVEAGLRSGDLGQPFPEEANRRMVSVVADLHFAPTDTARANLLAEGIAPAHIMVTGNTVIDALHAELRRQETTPAGAAAAAVLDAAVGPDRLRHRILLVTGHRRENHGAGMEAICEALIGIANRYPDVLIVYPVHRNPRVRGVVERRLRGHPHIRLVDPLPYAAFARLLSECHLVLTDSGGIQEEAPGLGKPVLVMRAVTERPEGIEAGTVALVGTDPERIMAGVSRLLDDEQAYRQMARASNPYGDGRAAGRIAAAIRDRVEGVG